LHQGCKGIIDFGVGVGVEDVYFQAMESAAACRSEITAPGAAAFLPFGSRPARIRKSAVATVLSLAFIEWP
jgi:hypothetical protein